MRCYNQWINVNIPGLQLHNSPPLNLIRNKVATSRWLCWMQLAHDQYLLPWIIIHFIFLKGFYCLECLIHSVRATFETEMLVTWIWLSSITINMVYPIKMCQYYPNISRDFFTDISNYMYLWTCMTYMYRID